LGKESHYEGEGKLPHPPHPSPLPPSCLQVAFGGKGNLEATWRRGRGGQGKVATPPLRGREEKGRESCLPSPITQRGKNPKGLGLLVRGGGQHPYPLPSKLPSGVKGRQLGGEEGEEGNTFYN